MAVTKKYSYTWPEGVTPVPHQTWVESLSPADRIKYDAANARQQVITDAAVAAGKLTLESFNRMVWVSEDDVEPFVSSKDTEWVDFHLRYCVETKAIFNVNDIPQ